MLVVGVISGRWFFFSIGSIVLVGLVLWLSISVSMFWLVSDLVVEVVVVLLYLLFCVMSLMFWFLMFFWVFIELKYMCVFLVFFCMMLVMGLEKLVIMLMCSVFFVNVLFILR